MLTAAALCALSCTPKNPASTPTPVNPPAGPPAAPPPPPAAPGAIRLGPSALRYIAHQTLHAEQQLPGQATQIIERGTKLFLTATIVGPADSLGYRLTLTVDSVALDSGTTLPPNIDLSAARRLVYDGRVTPWGIATIALVSDTARAAPFVQLLDLLRTFYPQLPVTGLIPGAHWTDTVTTTDRMFIDVTRRAVRNARTGTWEERNGIRALGIDMSSTYEVSGKATQSNQPVEVAGSGTETTRYFLASDGRYLGSEGKDSASITITFPYQTATIPANRVLRSTIIAQP
ncbi:MAG TPA: hypothetical protein VE714_07745 [Gemmatimonadales bacterium]|nr:hypothetical protein [Gemmatimonadales bacterium]